MITYYPWSESVLKECLSSHLKNELVTLDLELTAKCTHASCIYCDSKPDAGVRHPYELNFRETEQLLKEAKKLGLKWIYTCGLGEPLEDSRFEKIIETASSLGINVSLFTNGIMIDENKAKFLYDNRVFLILKLDTFEEKKFDTILGKKGASQKIYKALNSLLAAGYGKTYGDNYTDLALSIVPTRINIDDIERIILFSRDNNIFPSVGELEQAGRALEKNTFSDLALDEYRIYKLKEKIEEVLWKNYTRPICPTIITGIHVDNIGNCVADSETGLNCKWFLLKEPMIKILGNVRVDNLATLLKLAHNYRKECFTTNAKEINICETTEYAFGGCGGSPRKIIQLAKEHLL